MSLIHLFANEIELIQDNKIREFVVDALDTVPEFYEELTSFIEETKTAVRYSLTFLDVLDTDDYSHDVVISSILLQDLTRFYIDEEGDMAEEIMHPLSVRQKLIPLAGMIGFDKFDDILRTVESSHGFNSPIPQVMPQISDPVYIWILPFANGLAKSIEG